MTLERANMNWLKSKANIYEARPTTQHAGCYLCNEKSYYVVQGQWAREDTNSTAQGSFEMHLCKKCKQEVI